jgi:3-dehydroquinate synthase class II
MKQKSELNIAKTIVVVGTKGTVFHVAKLDNGDVFVITVNTKSNTYLFGHLSHAGRIRLIKALQAMEGKE